MQRIVKHIGFLCKEVNDVRIFEIGSIYQKETRIYILIYRFLKNHIETCAVYEMWQKNMNTDMDLENQIHEEA